MTRLAMRTVARKYGTHVGPATYIQSHIDSIHSPQSTRNTIMKLKITRIFLPLDNLCLWSDIIYYLCMKSVKFQRGIVQSHFLQTSVTYDAPKSCIPITANMKMMIHRTNVRLDRAPIVFAMIVRISLRDFQDFASLKTRSRRNDLSTERPDTPSARSSTSDKTTIRKSKQFQPS